MLVIVAAFTDGTRSVIAAEAGNRKSKDAWIAVLRTLIQRGMNVPRLVVADADLGLWAAIADFGWDCVPQHCWKHKTAEILALLPKPRQSQAAEMLRAMSNAATRADAKKLRERFVKRCGVRLAEAGERLCADWKQLTSFYAFPKDHWPHLRTTQLVESPLASMRLCGSGPEGQKTTPDAEAILWKLMAAGSKIFRRLDSPHMLPAPADPRVGLDAKPGDQSPTRAA